MMTLLEDVRLALRQICRSLGLPGDVATAVSLIVLGVALNVVALRAVQYAGIGRHASHKQTALRCAARTELKVVRTMVASTLKKVGNSRHKWCVAQQWLKNKVTDNTGYHVEVGFSWSAPKVGEGCDVTITGSPARKTSIAFLQC